MKGKRDPDLLAAVVEVVDAESADLPQTIEVDGVLKRLLGYTPEGIAVVAVQRAMLSLGLSSVSDLDEHHEELSRAVRTFMDGFIIATRYAREHQDP